MHHSWNRSSDSAANADAADRTSLQLLSTVHTADKVTTRQEHRVYFTVHAHFARSLFLQFLVLHQHVCCRNQTYINHQLLLQQLYHTYQDIYYCKLYPLILYNRNLVTAQQMLQIQI